MPSFGDFNNDKKKKKKKSQASNGPVMSSRPEYTFPGVIRKDKKEK